LESGILTAISGSEVNGHPALRLANTTNIHFPGIESEALLLLLDQAGICASSGSACTSGSLEPSHVLMALGMAPDDANGSVRFTLGHSVTAEDVDYVLEVLPPMIERLRAVAPCAAARTPVAVG
jgi:cysteine desulfurase